MDRWTMKMVVDLAALGVKEVTVTEEAAKDLTGKCKGVFKPDACPDFKPNQFGQLCGISFFCEAK